MKTNNYAGIDPHVVKVIEREVEKLRGRFGLATADLADIRQDLHLAVWSALGKLGAGVNREAAVNRIVSNLIRNLIRDRQRECRDWRREVVSIHEPQDGTDNGDATPFGDAEDLESRIREASGMPPCWHERRAEAMDAANILRSLSGDLRSLADALDAAGGNLSEAALLLNIPRKKARLMFDRLRKILEPLRMEFSNPLETSAPRGDGKILKISGPTSGGHGAGGM
jgi:DNA-directed RNA polymerase specialized sigma24 family protein